MPGQDDTNEPVKAVAPGYPAVEALRDIDVSAWEPAAVFRPVELSGAGSGDEEA